MNSERQCQRLCHYKEMGTTDFYGAIHIERCQTSTGKSLTLNATLTVNRILCTCMFLPSKFGLEDEV